MGMELPPEAITIVAANVQQAHGLQNNAPHVMEQENPLPRITLQITEEPEPRVIATSVMVMNILILIKHAEFVKAKDM